MEPQSTSLNSPRRNGTSYDTARWPWICPIHSSFGAQQYWNGFSIPASFHGCPRATSAPIINVYIISQALEQWDPATNLRFSQSLAAWGPQINLIGHCDHSTCWWSQQRFYFWKTECQECGSRRGWGWSLGRLDEEAREEEEQLEVEKGKLGFGRSFAHGPLNSHIKPLMIFGAHDNDDFWTSTIILYIFLYLHGLAYDSHQRYSSLSYLSSCPRMISSQIILSLMYNSSL